MLKSKKDKNNIEESYVDIKKKIETENMPKSIFEIFQGWQKRVLQLFSFFTKYHSYNGISSTFSVSWLELFYLSVSLSRRISEIQNIVRK